MGEKLNVEETSAQGQVSPGQAQTTAGLSSKNMTPLKERGKSVCKETLTQSTLARTAYPFLLSTCLLCDEANRLSLIATWK